MNESVSTAHAVDEPIFVVGTGRSGTTLLRMMLNAHPRIYLTHEASFYLSTRRLPRNASAEQWLERFVRTFSFRWLRLAEAAVREELSRDPGHSLAAGFRAVMKAKARTLGRGRWGDKTPLHSVYLKRIFRDFPRAKVVHVVRDPRPTVASLARMPWATPSLALNSYYCDQQVRAVLRFDDRVHHVRLEDLLADPRPVMEHLLTFLEEPWDEAVLDHENHLIADDLPPFPWFMGATRNVRPRPPSEPSALKIPAELNPEWVRIIERMNRRTMERFQYPPFSLSPEPNRIACFRTRYGELPVALRAAGRLIRITRAGRSANPPDPQETMEQLLQLNPEAWRYYPDFRIPSIP